MSESAKYYDLTHSQMGIWYTEKLYPGTSIGNIAGTLKINGKINYELLEKSILNVIEKNEALHFRFIEIDGKPYQYLADDKFTSIDFFDFSQYGPEEIHKWDRKQTYEPFDIIDNPLFYFAILKIDDNTNGFYFKIHHLIADGWSIIHATNEIMQYYSKLEAGESISSDIQPSYLEYVESENEYLTSAKFGKDREFWNDMFRNVPELATIKARTSNNIGTRAKRKTFMMPSKLCTKIQEYCQENKTSVFALFLSALAIYLNRVTGNEEMVIGVPVLNRSNIREKDTIGMFIATVPLRIKVDGKMNFREFSNQILRDWLAILKHHKYPYDLLLKEVREKYKYSDELYDIVLSYQNAKFVRSELSCKHEGRWHFNGNQKESLYIHINDREDEGNLIIDFDYLVDMFYPKEIDFIEDHIVRLLWHALDNPEKQLSRVDMLSEKEKHLILEQFNDTCLEFQKNATIHELFEEQVKATPDSIAAVFHDSSVTYRELNDKAGRLAAVLRKAGAGQDVIVGIAAKRSLEMLIAMLGVLKSGAAYLPIDPDYPKDRVNYMLENSKATILIDYGTNISELNFTGKVISLNDNGYLDEGAGYAVKNTCNPGNLAYVIYTSGSTGKPKGVMIEHHSVVNFIEGIRRIIDFSAGKTILSVTTVSFDIFVLETLLSLSCGLKVVIADENEQKVPALMNSLIKKHKIDMMQTTPSRINMILEDSSSADCLSLLSTLMIGGEAFPEQLLKKLNNLTEAEIFNMYGPTETTVWSTVKELTGLEYINIGKPIGNTQIYILDKQMQPVPIGFAGELYIGGEGLARGYIDLPELTADRFVENPFIPGQKIYRTGDLARWYTKGEIEHLGRVDFQLKIRGFRIEPGEIESKLLAYPGVTAAIVVDKENSEGVKYLCAYLLSDSNIDSKAMRSFLLKELPNYMVPACFVRIDRIPLTPNGKIDKKALADLDNGFEDAGRDLEFRLPANDTEEILRNIWTGILGNNEISTDVSFFDIGGDSLFAISLISHIRKEMDVEISLSSLFQHPTIIELAQYITELGYRKYEVISKVPKQPYYQVSSQQRRLHMLNMIEGGSTAYNMPGVFLLDGYTDTEKVEAVFRELIKRHESFRTGFVLRNGELLQKIEKSVEFKLEYADCAENDVDRLISEFIKPFDLSKAPMLRAKLLKVDSGRILLVCDMHHIIADGSSVNIMLDEFTRLYNGKTLEDLSVQYKDYAAWQGRMLNTDMLKKQEKYWLDKLSGEIPVINLPADYQRPAVQGFEGGRVAFFISPELTEKMKYLAAAKESTLFMVLLSIYYTQLFRYTGQEDIIVGTPISGRNHADIRNLVGMFVNTLALRCFPDDNKMFSDFLVEVRKCCLEAYENQDYQFEEIVSKLKLKRDLGRNPLFDTMFILQSMNLDGSSDEDIRMSYVPFDSGTSKFDLTFEAFYKDNGIEISIEYSSRLFKRETIERMAGHYVNIASAIAQNPDIMLSAVDMLSPEEKSIINGEFNNTEIEYKPAGTIDKLFEEQVKRTPDSYAVVYGNEKITYRELNERANRVAGLLRKYDVRQDTIVGIMMQRSTAMIEAILGVLKAGGAYLPIDPDYPAERVSYMLSDSCARLLVTDCDTPLDYGNEVINIMNVPLEKYSSSDLNLDNKPESLIYVIYTSGSTGRPKAVMLEHKNISNLMAFQYAQTNIDFTGRVLQFTTISFDVCAQEIFSTLLAGGELHIVPKLVRHNMDDFIGFINDNRIEVMFLPPSFLKLLMSRDEYIRAMPATLRHLIVAGEQLVINNAIRKYLVENRVYVHNHYGPSETHVVTAYTVSPDGLIPDLPPIGKPVSNTEIHILSACGALQPIGVAGELYISGDSVGRGYLYREELTNEKFVSSVSDKYPVMYKTGDLARWLPDGNIEFLGRRDFQVKIRGFRIELGEIESQLINHQEISEAVVIAKKDSNQNKYLCAFYVSSRDISVNEIRSHLHKALPDYMLPSRFVRMPAIPMTPNGKIDRKKLNEYDFSYTEEPAPVAAQPRNETDRQLQTLWSLVLSKDEVGIDDNFFEIGGDSLSLIQVQIKVLQNDWGLTTQDYYNHQTIRELSDRIAAIKEGKTEGGMTVSTGNTAAGAEDGHLKVKPGIVIKNSGKRRKTDVRNVLITGATGFLGIHIMESILKDTQATVYCMVRGLNTEFASKRLGEMLGFYFGQEFCEVYADRIHVLAGDVKEKNFGISEKDYIKLGGKVDALINAAAIVKHYGSYSQFEEINVTGTKNTADFCMRFGIPLHHISTIGVSGDYLLSGNENSAPLFTEDDYDIGQNYNDNVYIKSKFEAEGVVFKARKDGLKASVYRVGNLTGRMEDGHFQRNINENAFYKRLKTVASLGVIQDNMLDLDMEFSPVDCCSSAIVRIVFSNQEKQPVYHMYNPNMLKLGDVIKFMNKLNMNIDVADKAAWEEKLNCIARDENKQGILAGIISYMNGKYSISYRKQISLSCEKTVNCLGKLGFEWPVIDLPYISRVFNYMRMVRFIDDKIEDSALTMQ